MEEHEITSEVRQFAIRLILDYASDRISWQQVQELRVSRKRCVRVFHTSWEGPDHDIRCLLQTFVYNPPLYTGAELAFYCRKKLAMLQHLYHVIE
jgi:hypothetical protein